MPPREPFRLVFLMSSSEEAERLASTLRNAGLLIHHTHLDNVQKLEPLLQESWDLILCEAGLEAIQALAIIKEQGRDIPLIILSPEPSSAAIDPLAYGARDVVNPAVKALLVHAVKRELEALEQRRMLDHCQHSLGECEERNRILMDSSRDAIAYIHEGMHIYANTAYLDMFGFMDQDELSGVPLLDLIAPEDVPAFKALLRRYQEKGKAAPAEIHVLHSDGRRLKVTVELSPARMEGEPCMQIVFRKAREAAPGEHLDPLTGLYLRPYFLEALSRAVARAQQGKGDSALLFISLDNLPGIRQALGIQASDHLLAEVAQWIKDALPPGATAARFSEDTLAVLTQGGMDDIRAFAENLRRQAEGHVFELLGKTAITTLSIGIALITDQTESADEALRAAESALKEAMKAGGNQIVIHRINLPSLEEEQQWSQRIERAMEENRLHLYFQPIVALHGEPKPMYEVLLRLIGEEGEVILPETFLPFAAHAGMLPALDRWVTERTLELLAKQHQPIHLFVKLDDSTLLDEGFVPWVAEQIKDARFSPEQLIFEIRELSAATHLKQAKAFVEDLRAMHVGVAISHFGEGIHPFGILKHIKADYLMIDGAFIRQLAQDPEKQETVRNLVEQAKSLGKIVIAENVEDANSLALLWQFGVHYARGYYIQVPSESLDFDFQASL